MNLESFLLSFSYCRVPKNFQFSDEMVRAMEIWRKFRAITSKIEFGCNHDSVGRCNRDRLLKNFGDSPFMGCCAGCVKKVGYLNPTTDFAGVDVYKTYARHFSKKFGFWRPKIGCVLPREMRSDTCVKYFCEGAIPILRDADGRDSFMEYREAFYYYCEEKDPRHHPELAKRLLVYWIAKLSRNSAVVRLEEAYL